MRVVVYYDENDETVVEVTAEGVELGHFDEEESFSAQELSTLRTLIEDALPLLDESSLKFGRSVCEALLVLNDHTSLLDSHIAEYDRLALQKFVLNFF